MHAVFATPGRAPNPAFVPEEIGKDGQAQLRLAIAQRVQHAVDVEINRKAERMGGGPATGAADLAHTQGTRSIDPCIEIRIRNAHFFKNAADGIGGGFQHTDADRSDVFEHKLAGQTRIGHFFAIVGHHLAWGSEHAGQIGGSGDCQTFVHLAPIGDQDNLRIRIDDVILAVLSENVRPCAGLRCRKRLVRKRSNWRA